MPGTSRSVTVATTPVKLASARPPHARTWMTVAMPSGDVPTVYYALGVPTVSPANGTPLYGGDVLTVENSGTSKPAANELWAVTGSGSVDLIVAEGA